MHNSCVVRAQQPRAYKGCLYGKYVSLWEILCVLLENAILVPNQMAVCCMVASWPAINCLSAQIGILTFAFGRMKSAF